MNSNPIRARRLFTIALMTIVGCGLAQAADIPVSQDITTSETWTADNVYTLDATIFVRDGATLSIEPGTVVRGVDDQPFCSVTTNQACQEDTDCPANETCLSNPGALVVTRGSKIQALGTYLKPIVFTNTEDDNLFANSEPDLNGNYDNKLDALGIEGTWGGVILLGYGYVANDTDGAPNPAREVQIEGLETKGFCSVTQTQTCLDNGDCPGGETCDLTRGFYGNCAASPLALTDCDDDDTGTMSYVSIRYGGFNLGAANEINGLTMGGVGRTTDLHHIEIFQNQDDGIEMFGGAASLKNVAIFNVGDDSVDFDEGWRGKIQFVFALQGTPGDEISDRGAEQDGGVGPDTSEPLAIPTIYNATYVGLGGVGASAANVNDPVKNYGTNAENLGMMFRDNAGGRYYNGIFANFGGTTVMIEGGSSSGTQAGTSGERSITAYDANSGNCSVTTTTTCTMDTDCPVSEACVLHYLEPDSTFQLELRDNFFWCFGNGDTIPTSIADSEAAGGRSLFHHDPGIFTGSFNNTYRACDEELPFRALVRGLGFPGLPNPMETIDPRVRTTMPAATPAPNDGFFMPVNYYGAFAPDYNWAAGWTAAAILGYFPTVRECSVSGAPCFVDADCPASQTCDDISVVTVNQDITMSQTWSKDNEYILDATIFVRDGATLTIEPGTVIRGIDDQPSCSVTTGQACQEDTDCPANETCLSNPGALVVTRGSKLQAVGNYYYPITFTNTEDDNVGFSLGKESGNYNDKLDALGIEGTWGGVILLGYGYVANDTSGAPNPAREVQIEGLETKGFCSVTQTQTCLDNGDCPGGETCDLTRGFYGNCAASPLALTDCDDNDAGTLNYVSIRYGGFNLGAANEINGLTMGGVGRETDIQFVEIFQNQDDGIEMFGGAVGWKNMAIINMGDDSVDFDEGWRGKGQFVFALQGTPGDEISDRGAEQDGGVGPDDSEPLAIPTIYNATYVGLGGNGAVGANVNDPTKNYGTNAENLGMIFRDNAGGRYINGFFANFGGTTVLIEGGSSSGTQAGTSGERAETPYTAMSGNCSVTTTTICTVDADCPGSEACVLHYLGPDSDWQLQLQDNVFWCFGNDDNIPTSIADAEAAGGRSLFHHDPGIFTDAAFGNSYLDCNAALPINELRRGLGFPGLPNPMDTIDPRAGSALQGVDMNPPNDGFFMPASYKGAFGSSLWTDKWTAVSRLGYHPSCAGSGAGPGAGPTPGEVGGLITMEDKATLRWDRAPLVGNMGLQFYDVLRSATPDNFSGATFLEQGDADAQAVDPEQPANGDAWYYTVRATNPCGDGTLGFDTDGNERVAP